MPTPPPLDPAAAFAMIVQSLSAAVAARTGWSLTLRLIQLITDRLRFIKRRFASIAARVHAGRPAPRRPRQPPVAPSQPRQSDPLPRKYGWLLTVLPEAVGQRGQLEYLLQQPEMVALLAAAPASFARPLRSLCRMLRIEPPAMLPPPRRAGPPAAPMAQPPPPSPPPPPLRAAPEPLPPHHACGPPCPA